MPLHAPPAIRRCSSRRSARHRARSLGAGGGECRRALIREGSPPPRRSRCQMTEELGSNPRPPTFCGRGGPCRAAGWVGGAPGAPGAGKQGERESRRAPGLQPQEPTVPRPHARECRLRSASTTGSCRGQRAGPSERVGDNRSERSSGDPRLPYSRWKRNNAVHARRTAIPIGQSDGRSARRSAVSHAHSQVTTSCFWTCVDLQIGSDLQPAHACCWNCGGLRSPHIRPPAAHGVLPECGAGEAERAAQRGVKPAGGRRLGTRISVCGPP